jgi:hypothetical protein
MLDHPGLQVVRHDPRHDPPNQSNIATCARSHVSCFMSSVGSTNAYRENGTGTHEQVHPPSLPGDRVGQLHRLARPVDLDRLPGLVTDPRRRPATSTCR